MNGEAPTPLPVACTLDAQQLARRRERWQELLDRTLEAKERTPGGVRLHLREAATGDAAMLAELVELERECCAFARFTIEREGEGLVLDVGSTGAGVDAVRRMFDA